VPPSKCPPHWIKVRPSPSDFVSPSQKNDGLVGSHHPLAVGGVPSGSPSGPLTSKPGGTHFLRAGQAISKVLRYVHSSTTESIYQVPDTPRTSDSEQPELPVAHPPAFLEEFEHGLRLGGSLPFVFSHSPGLGHRLHIAQDQVQRPATPNMDSGLAAVAQDVGVVASGVFDGVGKNGQSVKSSLIVD
jgi:hypothetical protein